MLRCTLFFNLSYSQSPWWHPQRSWINTLSHLRPAVPEERKLTAAAPSATVTFSFACTRGVRREEDGLVEDDAGEHGGVGPSIASRGRFSPLSMGARGHPGESNTSEGWLARPGVQLNQSGLWPGWCPHVSATAVRAPAGSPASLVVDSGVVNPSARCGCESFRSRLLVSSLSRNRSHGVLLGLLS